MVPRTALNRLTDIPIFPRSGIKLCFASPGTVLPNTAWFVPGVMNPAEAHLARAGRAQRPAIRLEVRGGYALHRLLVPFLADFMHAHPAP